jgi:hypothetical protein
VTVSNATGGGAVFAVQLPLPKEADRHG